MISSTPALFAAAKLLGGWDSERLHGDQLRPCTLDDHQLANAVQYVALSQDMITSVWMSIRSAAWACKIAELAWYTLVIAWVQFEKFWRLLEQDFFIHNLQCFDTIGCVTGRAFGLWKTECWFVGGDILIGDLHVLQLQLLPSLPSPLAPKNPKWRNSWQRLTQVHLEKGR